MDSVRLEPWPERHEGVTLHQGIDDRKGPGNDVLQACCKRDSSYLSDSINAKQLNLSRNIEKKLNDGTAVLFSTQKWYIRKCSVLHQLRIPHTWCHDRLSHSDVSLRNGLDFCDREGQIFGDFHSSININSDATWSR